MKIKEDLLKLKRVNFKRLFKFLIVGLISTITDFAILNMLSISSGISSGGYAALFSVISFLVANIISYHMNKNWTFKKIGMSPRYGKFLEVSIIGVGVNVTFVYLLTKFVSQDLFSSIVWLNISKFSATILVAFLNYYNYKRRVFNNPQLNEQTV